MNKKNNLQNLESKLETLIVGGGIVGAGIFRDLSLQGIPSVLIDKFDFTSQTSQSSSKMLHGGIRYLENMDFALVEEALHEKNLWLKLTPHLAYPQKFLIPVYKDSKRPLWMLKIGLFLYDLLSSFENIPHQTLGKQKTLSFLSGLKSKDLVGSGLYSDAVMDDSKLCLEVIYDGLTHHSKSQVLSYTEIVKLECLEKSHLVTLRDTLNEITRTIEVKNLVFATGPFTDKLLNQLQAFPWHDQLLPSRGSHLWIKGSDLPCQHPLVLTPNDGRVIFVIPQGQKVLVGTTEVPTEVKPNIVPSKEEVDYLLQNLKEYFPLSNVSENSIISQFAGIRPLVKEDSGHSLGKTARTHKIYQPRKNCWVILGGKYTTFRVMAQDIAREVSHACHQPYNCSLSKSPLKYNSIVHPFKPIQILSEKEIMQIIKKELPKTLDDFLIRRLGVHSKGHWNCPLSLNEFLVQHQDILKKNLALYDEQVKKWL